MRVLLIALLAAISYAQTEDLFHIYGDCDFEDGCIGSKNRSHTLGRAKKEECCIITLKHDVQLYFFSYFDIHSDDRLTIRGKDVHSSDEVPMFLCEGETLVWTKKTSHTTEGWEMCFQTYENATCAEPQEAASEAICKAQQAQTANGNANGIIFILVLAVVISIIVACCIWIWIEKCTKKQEGENFLLAKSKDSLQIFGKVNFPAPPEQILIFDVPYPAAEAPYNPLENEFNFKAMDLSMFDEVRTINSNTYQDSRSRSRTMGSDDFTVRSYGGEELPRSLSWRTASTATNLSTHTRQITGRFSIVPSTQSSQGDNIFAFSET